MTIENWKEDFDMYFEDVGSHLDPLLHRIKTFIESLLIAQATEIIGKVHQLIIEEMLVCQQEGERTSRLTSLAVKLQDLSPSPSNH